MLPLSSKFTENMKNTGWLLILKFTHSWQLRNPSFVIVLLLVWSFTEIMNTLERLCFSDFLPDNQVILNIKWLTCEIYVVLEYFKNYELSVILELWCLKRYHEIYRYIDCCFLFKLGSRNGYKLTLNQDSVNNCWN